MFLVLEILFLESSILNRTFKIKVETKVMVKYFEYASIIRGEE